MLKQVYKIDKNGYLKENYVEEFDEDGNCKEEFAEDIITIAPPQGLYRAKWTGTEWIETMTEEEYIATLPKRSEVVPSVEERLQSAEDTILFLLMNGDEM